jgi:hypothetical protein
MVNTFLRLGLFKLTSSKSYARFENVLAFNCFPSNYWRQICSHTILNTLASYKAFGFGLVKIVDQSERIEMKDLGNLLEICSSRFSETSSNSNRGVVNVKRKPVQENAIPLNCETFAKISLCQHFFDLENVSLADERMFYDNTKLMSIELAIEKAYNFSGEFFTRLLRTFMEMYDKKILFSKLALGLIKVLTTGNNVYDLKLGFKNIENAMNAQSNSRSEYELMLLRQITSLNLSLYSIKAHPERNLFFDSISLSGFQDKHLDNPKALLGTGGFGTIFKNHLHSKPVAIKFPSFRKEDQGSSIDRIRQEFLITKYLRHPSIIKVYGTVKYQDTLGIVFEYCEGGTLNELIKNKETSLSEKVKILEKIAGTLCYVHSKGYVHLDVKPHNVFFQGGQPILADFGLACDIFQDRSKEMKLGCTIFYSPPEQIRGSSPKTSSDVWAFGMTMYQLLTGLHPFEHVADYRTMQKNMFYHLLNDQGVRPRITPEMQLNVECQIMQKCWNIDPLQRPSMLELHEILKTRIF